MFLSQTMPLFLFKDLHLTGFIPQDLWEMPLKAQWSLTHTQRIPKLKHPWNPFLIHQNPPKKKRGQLLILIHHLSCQLSTSVPASHWAPGCLRSGSCARSAFDPGSDRLQRSLHHPSNHPAPKRPRRPANGQAEKNQENRSCPRETPKNSRKG